MKIKVCKLFNAPTVVLFFILCPLLCLNPFQAGSLHSFALMPKQKVDKKLHKKIAKVSKEQKKQVEKEKSHYSNLMTQNHVHISSLTKNIRNLIDECALLEVRVQRMEAVLDECRHEIMSFYDTHPEDVPPNFLKRLDDLKEYLWSK